VDIATMRTYIQSVVEIDSSDISDDTLNRFIGEAYDQVVYGEARWPWYEVSATFTTVSGTSDYSKATVGGAITGGLRTIAALRTDDDVLAFIGIDEGDERYSLSSASTGDPCYWSFWGDNVRLYPTPSSALTINVRGFKNPTAFGAGSLDATEPSDFPEPFHILFATYGIARAYEQQEDPGMAAQYLAIFNNELDNLRARYLATPAAQPITLNKNKVRSFAPNRLRYAWE